MPELVFKGKEFVYNHHLTVPFRPLEPHLDKSIGDVSLDGNLIIHGDNLHALKALMPMYAGKVDCIFIDPPYNTGNEGWCYNDNVNSPVIQEWLNDNPVGVEDGLRHDKWCAMMYPRLKLLKELLSTEGFIAATIDDNEVDRLLGLMDDVFGPKNRLALAVWLSDPSGGKQKSALRTGHEYIVVYGGGNPTLTLETKVDVSLDLEDSIGPYAKGRELIKWGAGSHRRDRESMFFKLHAPDGTEVWPIRNDGDEGRWRYGRESKLMVSLSENPEIAHWERRPYDQGVIIEDSKDRWMPYEKIRDPNKAFGWSTWLDRVATNADGTKLLKQIFGSAVFDTPKPMPLLEWVLGVCDNPDAIILDSFAGSGTTAHTTLKMNEEDGGNRRFILVECEPYADEITAERVRRVIQGYPFSGTQKTELYRQRLNFTNLRRSAKLLEHIAGIENFEGLKYDRIKKEVKNGELIVTGEKQIDDSIDGISGTFTFCTLGQSLDFESMLTGESLPEFTALGAALFHVATNTPFDDNQMNINPLSIDGLGYLGSSESMHVWLIYKPDVEFLKSREAALTLAKSEAIVQEHTDKRHLVFAPARFVSQKILNDARLPVEFAPLPFALYSIERGRQS